MVSASPLKKNVSARLIVQLGGPIQRLPRLVPALRPVRRKAQVVPDGLHVTQVFGRPLQQLDRVVEIAGAQLVRALVQQRLGIRHVLPPVRDHLLMCCPFLGCAVEMHERSPCFDARPTLRRSVLLRQAEQSLRLLETAGIPQIPGRRPVSQDLGRVVIERHVIFVVHLAGKELELPDRLVDASGTGKGPHVA